MDLAEPACAGREDGSDSRGRRCAAVACIARTCIIAIALIFAPSAPAQSGVCDRTPQVRDAIVDEAGGRDCSQVSDRRLREIRQLILQSRNLSALQAGDFAGLSAVEWLDLRFNKLRTLPVGVFDGLTALQFLLLEWNELRTLPARVFDGLLALEELNLSINKLRTLPVGVFDGLTALQLLQLRDNRLGTLPIGVFSGLTALHELDL